MVLKRDNRKGYPLVKGALSPIASAAGNDRQESFVTFPLFWRKRRQVVFWVKADVLPGKN
jgi:hypothetical protein